MINQGFNIVVTGSTGTGKSWIACAIGKQACRLEFSVLYLRFSKLLEKLRLAKADGTYSKLLKQLLNVDLLILDDWLLDNLDKNCRHEILEIVEDRYKTKPILLTSQLPAQNWHDMIGNPTIADAILDRLLNQCIKFELKGESMRKKVEKFDVT